MLFQMDQTYKHTHTQQTKKCFFSGKQEYHVWIILPPAEIVSNDAFFPADFVSTMELKMAHFSQAVHRSKK